MNRFFNTIGLYIKQRYPIYILSLWVVFIIEFLSRGRTKDTIKWIIQHFGLFLFNGLIIACLIVLLASITGRTRLSYWIVTLFALIVSFISGIKLKILGVPLLPWDFVLTGEAKDMTPYLKNLFEMRTIIGLIVFLAVSIVLLHTIPHFQTRVKWKEKMTLAVLSVCLLSFLLFEQPVSFKTLFNIESISWNQSSNVSKNGFMLASLMNLEMLFIENKNYDKDLIQSYLNRYPEKITAPDNKEMLPNIIVILSESFWDPTLIKDVQFSHDPLPFFHSLQKQHPSGWLLSPQFGGGTANVEFEVLTGHSMRFLPQGSVAYNQYITHEVDSLASIASRQGYNSTAISPFHSWFFKSKDVYRHLGFDKYASIEFFDPVYSGPYIADSEVAKMIIQETSENPGPHFIFANTMENHFHYYPGKFEKNTVKVSGDIEPVTKGLLETYATGISAADNMLRTLVDYYSLQEQPTLIVFFGDHLPVLGDQYKAFIDSNYISGVNDPDFLYKMYKVPFVTWNNFMPANHETLFMSPAFLGPYILKMAGLQNSTFMNFLSELYEEIPVIPPKNYYSSLNIDDEDLKQYETLQQDILFGERLAYGSLKNRIENPNFILGAGVISIDHVTKFDNAAMIEVSGPYVPSLGIVYLNDKPLETTAVKRNTLEAIIPPGLGNQGTWRVEVRIIDSENTLIAKSNSLQIEAEAE